MVVEPEPFKEISRLWARAGDPLMVNGYCLTISHIRVTPAFEEHSVESSNCQASGTYVYFLSLQAFSDLQVTFTENDIFEHWSSSSIQLKKRYYSRYMVTTMRPCSKVGEEMVWMILKYMVRIGFPIHTMCKELDKSEVFSCNSIDSLMILINFCPDLRTDRWAQPLMVMCGRISKVVPHSELYRQR